MKYLFNIVKTIYSENDVFSITMSFRVCAFYIELQFFYVLITLDRLIIIQSGLSNHKSGLHWSTKIWLQAKFLQKLVYFDSKYKANLLSASIFCMCLYFSASRLPFMVISTLKLWYKINNCSLFVVTTKIKLNKLNLFKIDISHHYCYSQRFKWTRKYV